MQNGGGRGRGVPSSNAWTTRSEATQNRNANIGNVSASSGNHVGSTRRFDEACAQIHSNVKKHVQNLVDSSDEESSGNEGNDTEIIRSVLDVYSKNGSDLSKTEQTIKDSLRSGTSSCLICISSIKKTESIWSCSNCFCDLHLTCIQRWAKDSIFFQTEAAAERLPPGQVPDPRKFSWSCPKCRTEYPQPAIPSTYLCYCGKVTNPSFDPWLIPHSCGGTCEKPLKNCSHACLLLCHPGACPPCPKTVSVTCYCKKSPPTIQRCSSQKWSCGKKCSRLLSCGQHHCEQACHDGDCPPCSRTSIQYCLCGNTKETRPCEAIEFQCEKVCGKALKCGHHTCEVLCHAGSCPPCPLTLKRSCPCGKKAVFQPCTTEIGTCGDTCNKLLECGVHKCAERCHKGKCGTCWQMRIQRCRCGLKQKELPCYKEFHCETKCKSLKDCRRHPCNRKCCPGTCPPCDQPCNRQLGCRNHKCASRCHQGPCYPCAVTVDVTCACRRTSVRVPCGSERHTKPPKCSLLCEKAPDCHHAARTKHVCHFGTCPPCQQPCNRILACSHICPAPCHTSVLVQVSAPQVARAGPWEAKQVPKMERKKLPCPPCQVPVPVACIGKHETTDWPCHKAVPSSCGRPCGYPLTCTNHTCRKPCHSVGDGQKCEVCELGCSKPRPEGCSHPCPRGACHPGSCPPCTKMVKYSCHCGLNPQLIRCNEWVEAVAAALPDSRNRLLSCKDQCPKRLPCGHRCSLTCHADACLPEPECAYVVNASCPCKRIKKAFICSNWQQRNARLDCDDVCQRKKEKDLKARAEKEQAERDEVERRQRIEYEQYQRKFEKRRGGGGKERRRDNQTPEPTSKSTGFKVLAVLVPTVIALVAYFLARG